MLLKWWLDAVTSWAKLFEDVKVAKREAHTFTPYPGVKDHACYNKLGGYRCDTCFGPIVCHGEPLSGIPPEKYATPETWRQCKNFQTDGPTPCWYPSCVINERAHGHE